MLCHMRASFVAEFFPMNDCQLRAFFTIWLPSGRTCWEERGLREAVQCDFVDPAQKSSLGQLLPGSS